MRLTTRQYGSKRQFSGITFVYSDMLGGTCNTVDLRGIYPGRMALEKVTEVSVDSESVKISGVDTK